MNFDWFAQGWHCGGVNPSAITEYECAFLRRPVLPDENAEVSWINFAWFAENGVNTSQKNGYAKFKSELLTKFSFRIHHTDSTDIRIRDSFVDRYGCTGLAGYGGSGRAAIISGFQVKGVGSTGLQAADADWHHSHGHVWLEEALREAVFSEIVRKESPVGAIPVLAVIDLKAVSFSPDQESHRQALLVRPFVPRPCHLQRALMHNDSLESRRALDHVRDVERVRWYWREFCGNNWEMLRSLARLLGKQAAYAQEYCWFHGGFSSSNVSLDGKFIDFGSARYQATNARKRYEPFGQAFGSEIPASYAILNSLFFSLKKYGHRQSPLHSDEELSSSFLTGFRDQIECYSDHCMNDEKRAYRAENLSRERVHDLLVHAISDGACLQEVVDSLISTDGELSDRASARHSSG